MLFIKYFLFFALLSNNVLYLSLTTKNNTEQQNDGTENKIGGGWNDGHGCKSGWRSISRLYLGRKGAHGRRPAHQRVRVLRRRMENKNEVI
jgi:hypothetical protein